MFKRFLLSFAIFGPSRRPMAIIHNLLIGANAIIIAGEHRLHSIIFFFSQYIYNSFSTRRKLVGWGVHLREKL